MSDKRRGMIGWTVGVLTHTCKSAHLRCKLPPTFGSVTSMTFAACLTSGPSYPKHHKEEKIMAAKVSLSFGKFSDTELDNFAQSVIDAMSGNAAFTTPPVTTANLLVRAPCLALPLFLA